MRVTVQLFARLREIAGQNEIELDVRGGASVDDVWRALAAQHPALAPFGASVSCAVNEDFARPGASVQDGDKVAFLPPVSGGSSSCLITELCSDDDASSS